VKDVAESDIAGSEWTEQPTLGSLRVRLKRASATSFSVPERKALPDIRRRSPVA
jgi:hypothetical protein